MSEQERGAREQGVSKDPLHGITLKKMLEDLVEKYGFEYLSSKVKIRCFFDNPSINSSLKFLRKTDWAREKIEQLYHYHIIVRKGKPLGDQHRAGTAKTNGGRLRTGGRPQDTQRASRPERGAGQGPTDAPRKRPPRNRPKKAKVTKKEE